MKGGEYWTQSQKWSYKINSFLFDQLNIKFRFRWIYNWGNNLIMDAGILWTIQPWRKRFLEKCYRLYVQKYPWFSLVIGLFIRNKETVTCCWAIIMISIYSAKSTEWIVYKILDRDRYTSFVYITTCDLYIFNKL